MKSTLIAGLLLSLGTAFKGQVKEKRVKKSYYDEYPSDPVITLKDFPDADIYSLTASTGSGRAAKRAEFGAIRDAQETILTPTRSIDSLFLRLPSET